MDDLSLSTYLASNPDRSKEYSAAPEKSKLTKDWVCYLFDYKDGRLYWRSTFNSKARGGNRAGKLHSSGYRRISIDGVLYLEHRVIYIWHHGDIGEYDIDHINGTKDDNRIENLRTCTNSQNQANRKTTKGYSIYKGVKYDEGCSKPWRATIQLAGESYNLGSYSSEEQAALAYDSAARKRFGEFARTNFEISRGKQGND
ncbi:HNH endonuclease [uncultured Amphritea sp.]|uniref:HNH endonuclease n=1 Tax=uncultured Amphritea sp. TaxID=981605 RepID=UPI0026064A02|nr:HNH endonuclease [uncultured Amphritea sp.]